LEAHKLETLKEKISQLEDEISELKEKIKQKAIEQADIIAKTQARFFLSKLFIPFFEGVCDVNGVTLEDGIKDLIDKNITLDNILKENMDKTQELMKQPEFRIIYSVVAPISEKPPEWISEKSETIIEVMDEIRPELATIIREHENGHTWFSQSLLGIRNLIFPPNYSIL